MCTGHLVKGVGGAGSFLLRCVAQIVDLGSRFNPHFHSLASLLVVLSRFGCALAVVVRSDVDLKVEWPNGLAWIYWVRIG